MTVLLAFLVSVETMLMLVMICFDVPLPPRSSRIPLLDTSASSSPCDTAEADVGDAAAADAPFRGVSSDNYY